MMGAITRLWRRCAEQGFASPPERVVFAVLWGFSWVYLAGLVVHRGLYRLGVKPVYHATVPVISVGNLTVGGTGKTPMTDFLMKRLLRAGRRVAVVSRGYGGRFRGPWGLVADSEGRLLMTPDQCGDEPCLLAQRNPQAMVFVARRRALGVAAAVRAGAGIVLLDDGFQHRALHRDCDIVLLDARRPFGNGHLLPAGLLREPVKALKRSHLIVLAHDHGASLPQLPVTGPVLRCRHRFAGEVVSLEGERLTWAQLRGVKVLAFAGIARPEGFFAALREQGVHLSASLALADHQEYSRQVLNRLAEACHNAELMLTTEKDAVKLSAADLPLPCYRVPLELDFSNLEHLDQVLETLNGMGAL